jgi:oligo-1,6-glucosidase
MVFTFEHMSLDQQPGGSKWDLAPLTVADLKENLNQWQVGLADVGWNSLYWNNHDQPRIVSRLGDDGPHRVTSAKSLGTVLHLMRGTPYIYQGEELGMTNAHFTHIGSYRDIESVNWAAEAAARGISIGSILRSLGVKSRDNARTPMQWGTSPHAGFTTGTPWLAVNPNFEQINAAHAVADPDSVSHHYRRLIELRHSLPVVVHGTFRLLAADHDQVFAYVRTLGGTHLLVVANLSGQAATVDLSEVAELVRGAPLLATHRDASVDGGKVTVEPWVSWAILTSPGQAGDAAGAVPDALPGPKDATAQQHD